MNHILKIIRSMLYGGCIVLLVAVATIVGVSTLKIPGNFKILSVQSGSMEPIIPKGSIILIKPQSAYAKGDVITTSEPANPKVSLTHRIMSVEEKDGKTVYITKGDANNAPDPEKRPKEQVLGKTLVWIPYLGYAISFARTKEGVVILIVIPATLIIYSEFLTIKREIQKLFADRKKEKTAE